MKLVNYIKEKMTLITIQELPIEIIEIIFSMLPSVVDQINISLVCQDWRQIVLNLRHHSSKRRLKFIQTRLKLLDPSMIAVNLLYCALKTL